MDIEIKFYMAILFAACYLSVGVAIYTIFFIRYFKSKVDAWFRNPWGNFKFMLVNILLWPRVPWWIA